ncbi:hypothetical protein ABK040_002099 [Willaertia magna]
MKKILVLSILVLIFTCFLFLTTNSNAQEEEDFWNQVNVKKQTENNSPLSNNDEISTDDEQEQQQQDISSIQQKQNIKTKQQTIEDEEFDIREDDFTSIKLSQQEQTNNQQQEEEREQNNSEQQKKKEEDQQEIKFFGWPNQEHFYYEIGLGIFILLCAINYFIFRNLQEREFKKLVEELKIEQVLNKHFTKINFLRDGADQYLIYATGNEVMNHFTLKIKLPNRQDLLFGLILKPILSTLLPTFSSSQKPELTLEITMPRRFPLIFGFCDSKNFRSFLREHETLQLFTKHTNMQIDDKDFSVFTENQGFIGKVFSQSFVTVVGNNFIISDYLRPRNAGTRLLNAFCLRTTLDYNKIIKKNVIFEDMNSGNNQKQLKSQYVNWLDELLSFVTVDLQLQQKDIEKILQNRQTITDNTEREKAKKKQKEEGKENRLKKKNKTK